MSDTFTGHYNSATRAPVTISRRRQFALIEIDSLPNRELPLIFRDFYRVERSIIEFIYYFIILLLLSIVLLLSLFIILLLLFFP